MTPEFTARCLLRWALDETVLRIPAKLQRPAAWEWDDDLRLLVAITDEAEYHYCTVLSARGLRERAMLFVTNNTGKVTWEADIPAEVYAVIPQPTGAA